AVDIGLRGHLLVLRQERLDVADVHVDVARVRALLHHARDELALLAGVLAEHGVVARLAQALDDDLAGRRRRDAAEVVGGVGERGHRLRDDALLHLAGRVLSRPDGHHAGVAVELRAGVTICARSLVVRGHERLLDRVDEHVDLDVPLLGEAHERLHVDVHGYSSSSGSSASMSPAPASSSRRRNSISTLPRLTSANGTRTSPASASRSRSSPSTSVRRPLTVVPSVRVTVTSRVRARLKWRSSVSGRDRPGVLTSRSYAPVRTSASSRTAPMAREAA